MIRRHDAWSVRVSPSASASARIAPRTKRSDFTRYVWVSARVIPTYAMNIMNTFVGSFFDIFESVNYVSAT